MRWLLRNPFFIGKVRYKDTSYPGVHEPIIEEWLFEEVQKRLKAARRSGRSLSRFPRTYLLKGLARCIYCGFPLWSESSLAGYSYYREPRNGHAHEGCPATGKAIRTKPIDYQMDMLIKSLVLDPNWRTNIIDKVSSLSEHERVKKERANLNDRMRRLGKAFVDGLVEEEDYKIQRKMIQDQLDSLVIPEAEAAFDAGQKLENLGSIWELASPEDKHALLFSMLEAVYIDLAETRSIVGYNTEELIHPSFSIFTRQSGVECEVSSLGFRICKKLWDGGDGGGSNSPSRRSCPGHATSLVSSLILPGSPQLTELSPASR